MNKIGITLKIRSSLFSNGINQNAIFLYQVFKKIGYDCYLISDGKETIEKSKSFLDKDVKILTLLESFEVKFDLIIELGLTVEKTHFKNWSELNKNLKLVSYQCGNIFISETEKCLFKPNDESNYFTFSKNIAQSPHQIWSIPQMENSCKSIYQYVLGQENLTVVPFVWNPNIIEKSFKMSSYEMYKPRKIERCSVMEPNLSVMKNSIHPIITLEKNQKINKLKEIYIFSTDIIKNSKPFIDFIKSTDIYKSGVASVESRYTTPYLLNNYTDFVLSWQWENNLNYLYLDVAWLGWPIVHNGSLCKDIGYYYEGFNSDEAVERISEVISTHNLRWKEYRGENRKRIERYTDSNTRMLNEYKFLIENVLNDRFVKGKYDWETNSCFSNHVSL